MFIFGMINGPAGFDPMIVLLLAMAVDAYIGSFRLLSRFFPHPVSLIEKLVNFFDARLNRDKRSQRVRAVRGFVSLIFVTVICVVIGGAIAWLSRNHEWGWLLEFVLVISLISQRDPFNRVLAVGKVLRDDNLESARRSVAKVARRDPSQLDDYGIARTAIEALSKKFSTGVIAPMFWYVLFGLPGILVFKAVNIMDGMIGYRDAKYQAFGFSAARIDDILNIIPARLAGMFLCMAAIFTPTAHPSRGFKIMLRDVGKHRSLNAGWSTSAMAGALDLALAGPKRFTNRVVKEPWIGDGTAKATHQDIRRALYLYAIACLINTGWIAAIAIIRFSML
jgi:adenosylcobinamide-phosphate synthase